LFLRRTAPALLLLVLAPLVAEILLGDFSVGSLRAVLLVIFIAQYGGGALLIREVARRTGRGWPTVIALGLAYALIEEGFTTQTLFNPNWAGKHLLDYGYVPALGTSPLWVVFVLSIHVVWSIATPILIAEGVAGPRRATPWLGRIGVTVAAVLFVLGSVVTTFGTMQTMHFVAPWPQLAVVAVLVVAAVAVAFLAFRPAAAPGSGAGRAPSPWLVAPVALALGTAFEVAWHVMRPDLPAAITLLAMLVVEAVAVALLVYASRGRGWGPLHYLAIAAGTATTYAWVGLLPFLQGHTNLGAHTSAVDVGGQIVVVALVLALIGGGGALRSDPAA
jgi:hypothetical protein